MNRVNTETAAEEMLPDPLAEASVPHLAVLLERVRRRLFDQVVGRFHAAGFADLRPSHYSAMAFLPETGARLTELAQRARMTKQSMGELVMDLERRGYVQRLPDPTDRRARIVVFTERGRAANRAGIDALMGAEKEWAREVGAERMAVVRETLMVLSEIHDWGSTGLSSRPTSVEDLR